jgi:hypothetical protein
MKEAMNNSAPLSKDDKSAAPETHARRRMDAAAWALFFIWIGSAILANISWGWFLVGIGAIVLAAQVAVSRIPGENTDGPWLICGAVFLAAGVWEILGLEWPLAPLLMILLGVAVLWRAFFGKLES